MDKNSQQTDKQLSDELLNSFIDHQVAPDERREILDLIKKDKNISNRVCDLQHIKEMTKLAYEHIPASRLPETVILKKRIVPRIAAVIAIFSLGLLLGLAVTQFKDYSESIASFNADDSITKVLVHLTSSDIDSGINTLNNLQLLLEEYESNQQAVRVEVIANGRGIQLLDVGNKLISQRIKQLINDYHNLTIAACKYSIEQLQISNGVKVDLIPEVRVIDSGVVEVIKRQNEGWTYIRG